MADRQDRRVLLWVLLGAVFGPFALLFLAYAPPAYCHNCGSPTRGLDFVCWWCHEDVRVRPASVRAIDARMSGQRILPVAADREVAASSSAARPAASSAAPATAQSPIDLAGNGSRRRGPRTRTLAERADLRQVAGAAPRLAVEPTTARAPAPGPSQTSLERRPSRVEPTDRSRAQRVAEQVTGAAQPASIFIPTERPPARPEVADSGTDDRAGSTAAARLEEEQPRILASAVFVAGSARMTPGHRYGLALRANRFLVLGPTDDDPNAIVLDRPVAGLDVRAIEGRLILSEPENRSGVVLAFMAIAGPSTPDLAATIAAAASAAREGRA